MATKRSGQVKPSKLRPSALRTALPNDELVGLAVESLYGQALLLGHHPLRPADSALLNRSFLGLLQQAVPGWTGEETAP